MQVPGIAGDLRAQAEFKEREARTVEGQDGAKGDNLESTEKDMEQGDKDLNKPQQQTVQSSESDLEIVMEERVSGE